jgi:hypothetical protein
MYDGRPENFYKNHPGPLIAKAPYLSNGTRICKELPRCAKMANAASMKSIDALVSLTRLIATGEAYDTNGDIAVETVTRSFSATRWVPKAKYLRALYSLANEYEVSREVIEVMDRAIRALRASKKSVVDGRVLMCFEPGGENSGRYMLDGDRASFIFDITWDNKQTNDSTIATIEETRRKDEELRLKTAALLHSCFNANCGMRGELMQCRKCTVCLCAWYCSRTCQKDDWKMHKKVCEKK